MRRVPSLFVSRRLKLSARQKEQLANLFTNLSSALFISLMIPILFGVDIPQSDKILLGIGAGVILEVISLLIVK